MITALKNALANESVQQTVSTLVVLVVSRYLLEMSTPEKDFAWLREQFQWWYWLRWYRGNEYFRQVRGMRLLLSCLAS